MNNNQCKQRDVGKGKKVRNQGEKSEKSKQTEKSSGKLTRYIRGWIGGCLIILGKISLKKLLV